MKKSSSDETAKKKSEPKEESKEEVTQEETQAKITGELAILETHLSIADRFYYDEHNYEKAIEEYNLAINEEKDETLKLKANYMMAECHIKLGKYKEAKEILEKMATDFGKHYLGASAKRRLKHLSDYLVIDDK